MRVGVAALMTAAAVSLVAIPMALADGDMAMRWWNTLTPEQMVAALHGDKGTEAQAMAAKKMYAGLDADTKKLVDAAGYDHLRKRRVRQRGRVVGVPGLPAHAGGGG